MNRPIVGLLVACTLAAAGCGGPTRDQFLSDERQAEGLVIILPGIEGVSPLNRDIRAGLVQAGIGKAVPIYRWGRPVPLAGVLLNQMDVIGNRIEAGKIARMIVEYQDVHPGRSVYLVGHSGGGGMAVFAAEDLPADHKVDGLILLSSSISTSYDLTKALSRSRCGIVNFYNSADVGLLGIGTSIVGNMDGIRGPAAGLKGFDLPAPGDGEEKRRAYERLYQVPLAGLVADDDNAHAAVTRASFVSSNVAPWIERDTWPANTSVVDIAAEAK